MWWNEPGWRQTRCGQCGSTIWPEGDPDWGLCYGCFSGKVERDRLEAEQQREYEREAERYYDDLARQQEAEEAGIAALCGEQP